MKRIYLNSEIFNSVIIENTEHHYLKNVLRMKEGDILEILTPSELAQCEITEISKNKTSAKINTRRAIAPLTYSLTAYQCVLKREYMDTAIEKYTELGVTKIIPVISARGTGDIKDSTLRRYNEIAKAAALQSEREHLPEITAPVPISSISAMPGADNIIFCERGESTGTPGINHRNVQFIIGPEGGFSPEETAQLIGKGFTPATPMKQILKAETAAAVFAGWLMIAIEKLTERERV